MTRSSSALPVWAGALVAGGAAAEIPIPERTNTPAADATSHALAPIAILLDLAPRCLTTKERKPARKGIHVECPRRLALVRLSSLAHARRSPPGRSARQVVRRAFDAPAGGLRPPLRRADGARRRAHSALVDPRAGGAARHRRRPRPLHQAGGRRR